MVTVLVGANAFLIRRELQKFSASFVREYGNLALERLEGEHIELEQILDAVASVSFLSAQKMVFVSNLSQNKFAAEHIEHILESVADTTHLILYESSVDKRTVFYKTLKKQTDFREYNELDEHGLIRWIIEEAKQASGSISRGDAQLLVQRLGTNQMLLFNELQKLLTHDPNITREHIEALTELSPQSKIFDLLDAALAGNHKRALSLYDDQRAQRVEPQYILAMITWQLQNLAYVVFAKGKNASQIASEAKVNPYVVSKAQVTAKRLNPQKLKLNISRALNIDIQSKTSALNLDDALKHYILTL